ncbi:MAG TPA: ATP synthase subunit I [Paracoccaceae bacterium]|nr:ATP synthase subunit I [Paracoccaceae bacterium]
MTEAAFVEPVFAAGLALAFAAGAAAGAAHLAMLWRSTRALTAGRESPLRFALGGLVRPAATAGMAAGALALGAGAWELAAGAVGFGAARLAATGWARRGGAGTGSARRGGAGGGGEA